MSRNIDTVKQMYECFGKGDIAGILERLHPDVEWEHDWGGATLRMYEARRGRMAVPAFFELLADFEFRRFEPFAFLEGSDMLAAQIRLELVYKPTGKPHKDLEMHLWTFGADGLVARFRHFADTLQLARAMEFGDAAR